jgi:uncharacterized protein
MIIEIPKLRPEGEWFEGDEPAEVLDLAADPTVRVSEPIHYSLFVQAVSGQLVVKGELRLPLQVQCGRCTEFFSTIIAESSFLRAYDIPGAVETVDVTPDMREDILLQMPHYPVCSTDCKGLCPQCGTNLNKGSCSCKPPGDNRWSALDNVKLG